MAVEAKDYAIALGVGGFGGFLSHQSRVNEDERKTKENDRVIGLQQQKAKQLARNSRQLQGIKRQDSFDLEGLKSDNSMAELELNLASKEKIAGMKSSKPDFTAKDKVAIESKAKKLYNDRVLSIVEMGGSKEEALSELGMFDDWFKTDNKRAWEAVNGVSGAENVTGETPGSPVSVIGKHLSSRVKPGANSLPREMASSHGQSALPPAGNTVTNSSTDIPPLNSTSYSGKDQEGALLQPGTLTQEMPAADQPKKYTTVHSFGKLGEFATWVKKTAKDIVSMSDTQKQKFKDKKKEDKRKYLRKSMSPELRKEFVKLSKAEQDKQLDEILSRHI